MTFVSAHRSIVALAAASLCFPAVRGDAQQRGPSIPAGASRVTLDSAAIAASGARTLPELLAGRVAGLTVVHTNGDAGNAPRIQARGPNGTDGIAEPLLVVDGIVHWPDYQFFASAVRGGELPAFDWEIPVHWIERVDVVLGAAGGTLLDVGAPRGAVFVTTKRAPGGRTHVSASLGVMAPSDAVELPPNFGTTSAEFPNDATACTLDAQAQGTCTSTGLRRFNPLGQSGLLSARTGLNAGLQAMGAVGAGRYRVMSYSERSTAIMPDDGFDRLALAANYAQPILRSVTIETDVSYRRMAGRFAPSFDYLQSALRGRSADDSIGGFRFSPAGITPFGWSHRAERLAGAQVVRWSASPRLTVDASVRYDHVQRFSDRSLLADTANQLRHERGARDAGVAFTAGVRYQHGRMLGVAGSTHVTASLLTRWIRDQDGGYRISPPPSSSTQRLNLFRRLASAALREELSFGRSRRLGIGVRVERHGIEDPFDIGLPSVDLSWGVSDEAFFPKNALLSGLQLRASRGSATEQPFIQEFPFFGGRPQRTTETEYGLGTEWLGGAVALDVTQFHRRTDDASVFVETPSAALQPIGSVLVTGTDLRLAMAPRRVGPFDWRLVASATYLKHHARPDDIATFYYIPDNGPFYYFGPNAPIGSISSAPYTFADVNDDGIIVASEVTVEPGFPVVANGLPNRLLGLMTEFSYMSRLSFGAQLDGQGGRTIRNSTARRRCIDGICRERHDPNTSLERQAAAVALTAHGTDFGFLEDGDFVRLREVWVRIGLVPARDGGRGLELVLAGRNLATWTDYSGGDPESGAVLGTGLRSGDFASTPMLRSFTAQLRLAW